MAFQVEFHIADHDGTSFASAVNRYKPPLGSLIEGGITRIGQMTDIIEQVIPDATHGVHTCTPR